MKDPWVTRVAFVLVILLVGWNIYKGATVQELGVPGFTLKFGSASHGSEITGSWKYDVVSDVSHQSFSGAIDLTADGNVVSGEMDNPDYQKPGERSGVRGTYVNGTLTLTRNTNTQGIAQEYRLTSSADGFAGTFENVGQTSGPYKDNGTIRIHH